MSLITSIVAKMPQHPMRRWAPRSRSAISELIVHQAPVGMSLIDLAKQCVSPGCHLSEAGCPSFPHTFAILADGNVLQCNDYEHLTQTVGPDYSDFNIRFLSAYFLRDANNLDVTRAQMVSFYALLDFVDQEFGVVGLHGHHHWGSPSCPGPTLRSTIDRMRESVVLKQDCDLKDRIQIANFQRNARLRVTGTLDYDTIRHLNKVSVH